MHTRFALMLGLIALMVAVAAAVFFTGGLRLGVQVRFTPREDDGTLTAVDFARDLAGGRYESAWDRTAVAYRQETPYDGFVDFARRYFTAATSVVLEAGGQPGAIVGRISYDEKPAATFSVEAELEDGFWRVRQLSFGE